ncbi:non-ribosomal peptide synthetase [Bradyrhizobium sp. 6(2017)]|uniref:non-ribosomal peptide synthetase n=1 Tax=Bradyrhizobium sp. 6(2017) TaxID=1197460 RepID=UPI0013E1FC3F|nr:non-ribosomal peptide synthetase [Bradyrhizobium sp. 6(2017)]QIG97895.1 amino acid adenylation domain-containing protein [Bradyrhizobium sp. 6(2017)]
MASPVEQGYYPASANQRRMYVLNRLSPDGIAYNVPVAIRLNGKLDAVRLQDALSALVTRHDSLRTSFGIVGETIIQTLQAPLRVPLDFERARGKSEVEAIKRRFVRPFDLHRPPLLRASLIRLGSLKHVLLLDLHHIICDGVSIDILSDELGRLYDGQTLPPLPADYKDFALWQREFAGSEEAEQQQNYWLRLLEGERTALNLPTDLPRPSTQSFDGDRVTLRPNLRLTAALRELAAGNRVSMYMLLLAAYYVVLSKYSGQDDLVVGTLAAGRNAERFQGVIGLFVNTLALRSRPRGELAFSDYLQQVRDECLDAFENQDSQFEDLVDRIAPLRDLGRGPLFDTMFTALSSNATPTVYGGIEFSPYELDYAIAKFDLTLTVIEQQHGELEFDFEYCTDLFRRDTIERLSAHYVTALEAVVADPAIRLRDIDVSGVDERRAVVTDLPQPTDAAQSVVELFEIQARTNPVAPAIACDGKAIDYATLDRLSSTIAAQLQAAGAGPGAIVGLVAAPSIEAVAAILGILKLGAAFLPIDPSTPADRFRTIAAGSGMAVVLLPTDAHPLAGLGPVDLALDRAAGDVEGGLPDRAAVTGGDLAYVIYTSGSTGLPKGVMISHRALANYVSWAVRTYIGDSPAAFALHSPLSVDLTITSAFAPLVSGNRLVVYRNDDAMGLMRDILRDDQVEVLKLTPTHLALLAEAMHEGAPANRRLRALIVGGEDFKTGLARKVDNGFDGRVELYNEYGPTEATVGCMIYKFDPAVDKAASVPIGTAIDNVAVLVLDRYGLPVPRGAIGELHIAGACLADGYLNNPDMTAERFVMQRLGGHEIRLYKTGDLARMLPSGALDFLGRNDDQVKLRGFRIELGEIETALLRCPGVIDAVVAPRTDAAGDSYLCAYVVAAGAIETADLRRLLAQCLPAHMVPSRVVIVDRLPIGRSGKVDRTALPDPGEPTGSPGSAAPRSAVECAIAVIWEQVLGVQRIGLDDDFFDLGGQSLKATLMIARVNRELHAGVTLRDAFVRRTIRGLAGLVDETREDPCAEIAAVAPRDYYPVSAAQKRLFIIHQLAPQDVQYNVPFALNVTGPFDRARWLGAFRALLARHESLRTSFLLVDDQIVQKVHAEVDFAFEGRASGASASLAQAIEGYVRPFDLDRAPLLRATILNAGPVEHTILVDLHHIVADGLSIDIIIDDLRALYEGRTLEGVAVQYRDYAAWQHVRSASAEVRSQEAYWRAVFEGGAPAFTLPTDFPRGAIRSFDGDLMSFTVDAALAERLRAIGRAAGATLFMTLLAAYTVLLSKYTGQEDIVVGIPVAGRRMASLQRVVGMFVNTLATRNRPRGELRFVDYLDTVQAHALDAYDNQDYQFEELVDRLEIERDLGRNPLFDTVFATLEGGRRAFQADGVTVRIENVPWKISKFDLTLLAEEREDSIVFELEYCTGLFRRDTIERMANHFVHLLEQIASDPARLLRDLDPLTEQERRQVLVEFNRSEANYPAGRTVHELIEDQAERTPEAPAVVFGTQTLSYGELNRRANMLARLLVRNGIAVEDMVGIVAEPSLEMMIGILSILKAGAAYLPIDADCPADRAAMMLEDSKAKMVVFAGVEPWGEVGRPSLDLSQPTLYRGDEANLGVTASSRNLAYVIYTSGTTGAPKGVMVEHSAVNNLCAWHIRSFALSNADRTTKYARFSFDASVWEILPSLQAGAALHIVPQEIRLDLARLARYFDDAGITVSFLPTQICELFVQFDNRSLRLLLTGGDRLRRGGSGRYQLVNNYGPTESTVVATSGPVVAADGPISIGKPIANIRVYLVDKADRPVPIGVPGELCIAGAGLARGYLGDAVRTAEKFVANPFEPGERLYRTGDVARWRPDGSIDYLGRTDGQVKIRGCRIEPREVETAILAHEAVRDAVVVAREDRKGDKQLSAYIAWRDAARLTDLRASLGQRLPNYMLPAFFVTLDEIPLNARGKVDLAALQPADGEAPTTGEAPRTSAESRLAAIWQQVLDRQHVGIHDNFFAIGGDSLRATIMIAKANKAFGTAVALGAVFDRPTIARLAEDFAAGSESAAPSLVPVENRLHYAATPTQGLLYAVCTARGGVEYNLPMAFEIGGELDIPRLEGAFREVIDRHEALRTGFLSVDGGAVQYVVPKVDFSIARLPRCGDAEIGEVTRDFIRPFQLSAPPLIRAAVVPRGPGRHVLLIDMHHLVSDGTSMGLLFKEIAALYAGSRPPRPGITYKDFAEWLQGHLRSDRMRAHEAYWRQVLDSPPDTIRLESDFPRKEAFAFAGSRINCTADAALHDGLKALCTRQGVTLYVLLLAAYNVLLSKYSGREDIIIGVPTVGRYLADVHDVVGMFVSTHVIRSLPRAERRFDEFLQEVKAGVRGAVEHQEYQLWDIMVQHNVATGKLLFSAVFVVQDQAFTSMEIPGLEIEEIDPHYNVAKFDLTMGAVERPGRLDIEIEYNTDLFRRSTAARIVGQYLHILDQIVADPGRMLRQIEIVTPAEKSALLSGVRDTAPVGDDDDAWTAATVVTLFKRRVRAAPDRVAVAVDGITVTYRTLHQRTQQLGRRLAAEGVGPGMIVALLAAPSVEMISAVLAIWATGAACVPLAADDPPRRVAARLAETAAALLVCDRDSKPDELGIPALLLDGATEPETVAALPDGPADPKALAVVGVATDRSGIRKHVMIEHRSLLDRARWFIDRFAIVEADRTVMCGDLSSGAALLTLISTLCAGASVWIAPEEARQSATTLVKGVSDKGVTVGWLPATLCERLAGTAGLPLRTLIATGGAITPLRRGNYELVTCFGLPEHTEVTTCKPVTAETAGSLVGTPIIGSETYILGHDDSLLPIGVTGELCLGGAGLARGYLGEEPSISHGFTPNPHVPGGRIFRSGLRAKRLADGGIELIDCGGDVEIDGHRVHLAEIEHCLREHANIADAAIVRGDADRLQPTLCALVVTTGVLPESASALVRDLKRHLAEWLPRYMIPEAYVQVATIPRDETDRVAVEALPIPAKQSPPVPTADAADPSLVPAIRTIVEELVGVPAVDPAADLRNAGLTSLAAMTLQSRLTARFGIAPNLCRWLQAPSIANLSHHLSEALRGERQAITPTGETPPP